MATPQKFGSEFVVNTTTLLDQTAPTITSLANGGFAIAYLDHSVPPFGGLAYKRNFVQRFNADGSLNGGEIDIDPSDTRFQFDASLAATSDGGFVVTWASNAFGTEPGAVNGQGGILARVFGPDGTISGARIPVNTTTLRWQINPAVTVLSNGNFVVVWEDDSRTGGDILDYAVRAQMFLADGTKTGAEFLVNTTPDGVQSQPAITALAGGGFVITWTDSSATGGDTSGKAIRGQIYDHAGTAVGGEFLVNTATAGDQYDSGVTALAGGGFIVAWSGSATTGAGSYAQIFDSAGSKVGSELTISATGRSQRLVQLPDGTIAVTWVEQVSPGDFDVMARTFLTDGTPLTPSFRVNTTTVGDQTVPTIAALVDGRFVISWEDSSATGSDSSGQAIRAQIFDPRTSGVTLTGTALGDDYVGTSFGDLMDGLGGNDSFQGLAGSDTLSGRQGDDVLIGGGGDDKLFGGGQNDSLTGGGGDDLLRGGAGADTLKGSRGADRIFGGADNDILIGDTGNDTMNGGLGDDTFDVDTVLDVVTEASGEGSDTVRSSTISLDLANYANVENLELRGSAALDATGDAGNNLITGNDGANFLDGSNGDDTLNGGAGDDKLKGGGQKDRLSGEGGNDTLLGGGGKDTLTGGAGADELSGSSGADRFEYFSIADSGTHIAARDVIKDFSQADGDVIDLAAIDATTAPGDQAFGFVGTAAFSGTEGELRYRQTASDTIVEADVDGDGTADFAITLSGLIAVSAGDFIL